MPFLCVDCGEAGRDTPISREQAMQTVEKYGRCLCENCAFIAKPVSAQDRLTVACIEEWHDARGEKHVTRAAEVRT